MKNSWFLENTVENKLSSFQLVLCKLVYFKLKAIYDIQTDQQLLAVHKKNWSSINSILTVLPCFVCKHLFGSDSGTIGKVPESANKIVVRCKFLQ